MKSINNIIEYNEYQLYLLCIYNVNSKQHISIRFKDSSILFVNLSFGCYATL